MNNVKLIVLSCSLFFTALNAQTNKNLSDDASKSVISKEKANFVETQQYLKPSSSFKNYVQFYSDSLEGFDEVSASQLLLERRFFGEEFTHGMNQLKRAFINGKYKLGEHSENNTMPAGSANKPPGNGNTINAWPCVNEDFESTPVGAYTTAGAVAGWTIASGNNGFPNGGACVTPTFGANGSPEFSIVATPILGHPYIGTIPNSPLGGTKVACLNNTNVGSLITQIRQTFPVNGANTLFQFAYCGSWDGSAHACCDQPFFKVDIYNCAGAPLPCSSISLTPSGSGCVSGVPGYSVTGGISWSGWVVKYIDLTPYIGSCVTIKVTNGDCNGGAHHGSAYFDAKCGGNLVGSGLGGNAGNIAGPVSFCAGSNAAGIVAPLGYATYSWTGPPGVTYTPALANAPSITVAPVTVGQVFTVTMVSAAGCTFTAKDTIKYSSVYISSINTASTCPGGASGAATVFASGSSAGYSFTYTSVSNPTLNLSANTGSVASNLPPGTYSVIVAGGGGACGVASYSFQIGVSPPNYFIQTKPFCGNTAFFSLPGGTNYQWYNNMTPIPPPIGTASGLTVTPAVNNSIIILSYTTPQGCKDSIRYTLQSAAGGNVAVPAMSKICTGGANGTASVVLTPAPNAPAGLNQYQVVSTGTTPAYSSTLAPTGSNTYVPVNLQAGTYSVSAFDGSCKYGTTFTLTPYVFDYTVAPITSTICQGASVTQSINFGLTITGTPCSTIGVGAACTNPPIYQVGATQTGQNGTTTWPAPYGNWYRNARHQMLFTAAELTALGIGQGYLTSLAFNVITINGTTNYPNYTIKIKCTNVTALSGGFDNVGLSQVYMANHNVTVGWNTHNFTTPYYWDGASNILVDICYSMTPSYTQNSISPYRATTFASCRLWYSDSSPACMTTSAPFQTTVNRPLVRFGNCSAPNPNSFTYSWTPGTFMATTTQSNTIITPTTAPGTITQLNYSVVLTPTDVSCPLAKTFTATVVNPVTPTITAIDNFCNNGAPVTISVTPAGGTFSTAIPGNAIGAVSGIITPSLTAIGTNTFMYSVGVGSCTASNSSSFQVSQYNTAAFTSSIAPMCVTSPVVNLMGIVQTTVGGTWSGTSVGGNSFTPTGLATNTYALIYNTVSTPNATVCPETNTMVVSVLNPPTPTITAIGPYCNTASDVQMAVIPNTGTWTPVAFQSTTGVFSPSLAAIGINTVQYVIGTNTCNTQATSSINIEAFVPAVITGSIADQCNTNSVINLIPLTLNTLGTWSGAGVNGFVFDPFASGTGTINLGYTTNSSPIGLCPDQATIAVNVYSLATPVITQIGPFCNMNGGVQIPVSPLGGMFSSPNGNVVNQQGQFLPTQAVIGANPINYSVTSGPCVATAQSIINVEAFVSADLSKYAGPYCKNDPIVNLNSIVQNPGGIWSGQGLVGSLFNPATANIGNNNVLVYYTYSSPTQSLCPDSAAIRIQVNDIPNVTIVGNTEKGCMPVEVIFNTPNANSGYGTWNFGDGSPTESGLTVTHLYTTPGSYSVTFNYEDEIGCATQATLANPIEVYEVPHANFSYNPDEISMAQPNVQFSNLSTILGNNTYQWQIGQLYQLNDVNPSVTFPVAGDYNIILTATTLNGCKDVISRVINVKNDYGVYIPNSFTPNFDGVNDIFIPVFSPFGLDLNIYEMEIFDRWGHSLFKTKDATVGWDGFAKGSDEPLKQDVYVYKVKYKDSEGKIYHKTGHISLIK